MKIGTGKAFADDKLADAKRAAKTAAICRKHAARITATSRFLEGVTSRIESASVNVYAWVDVDHWVYDGEDPITLHINFSASVLSMKEGLVPTLLKVLIDAGCEIKESEDYVSSTYAARTFRLERSTTDKHCKVKIAFDAKPKDVAEATCRKVQIGTELKEVAVFKLECPEADLTA